MPLTFKNLDSKEFFHTPHEEVKEFIANDGAYIVKKYWSRKAVLEYRKEVIRFTENVEAQWRPLEDESPSFHRFNNEDERSYIKGRLHQFGIFLWRNERIALKTREAFLEVMEYKRLVAGIEDPDYMIRPPSSGHSNKVIINHFPCGGGYMKNHVDPLNPFHPLLMMIQGAQKGEHFNKGGLVAGKPGEDFVENVEEKWDIGDMLIFDPCHTIHGVQTIDPNEELSWSLDRGRMTFAAVGDFYQAPGGREVSKLAGPS